MEVDPLAHVIDPPFIDWGSRHAGLHVEWELAVAARSASVNASIGPTGPQPLAPRGADDQAPLGLALLGGDLGEHRHDLVGDDDVALAGLRLRQVQRALPPVDHLPAQVPDLITAHASEGQQAHGPDSAASSALPTILLTPPMLILRLAATSRYPPSSAPPGGPTALTSPLAIIPA